VKPGELELESPGHGLLEGGGARVHAVLVHHLKLMYHIHIFTALPSTIKLLFNKNEINKKKLDLV